MSNEACTLDRLEKNNVIKTLQERIPDLLFTEPLLNEPFYLYYYLRTRNFDVEKTEKFIREVMQWRLENNAEEAAQEEYEPKVFKCFKIFPDGKTKSGFPVYSANAGRFKYRDTISKHGKELISHYWIQILAKAEKIIVASTLKAREEFGDEVSVWPIKRKSWLILDMEGLSYWEVLSRDGVNLILLLVKFAVSYYPSFEGTLIFINAGRILEFFFKLIRPMLNGTNIDLEVFGTDESKWKPFLLEHIDACQLRKSFGGTLEDDFV